MNRASLALVMIAVGGGVCGADQVDDLLAPFASEPSVRELQNAAARHAEVHPDVVRSWQRRIRLAALAPAFKVAVGRGSTDLQSTIALDGTERLTFGDGDNWRFDTSASWSFDRLVFDKEELRLSREAQRLGSRREQLLTEVAQLYYERRRMQVALLIEPAQSVREAMEARIDVDEMTAILDGLTDGAMSRSRRSNR